MPQEVTFDAIGTRWSISVEENASLLLDRCLPNIKQRIDSYDAVYSRFRTDSLVNHIASSPGTYQFPPDSKTLIDLYQQLYTLTGGLFTPMIGQLLSDAGYDRKYSLQPKKLNNVPTWKESLDWQYPSLKTSQPVLLDTGAAGKGHLIDIIGELLESESIPNYCLDAGGDIRYRNSQQHQLRVGLEHPNDPKQVIGVATIDNMSICGSAGNRRRWGNYHHIMNPKTKSSAGSVLASWVTASTTIIADALSTCLFLVDPEVLINDFSFEYLLLYPDFSWKQSNAFPAELFT